ncbi:pyridoxal-phosphate dependent enzyme [Scytonema sp. UIC 10036]|uniref:pyridoxal-phosphate dependent enzyme n=1 Tax=Scytonema sp. UIC 10036 TaxID=2304196 RepID=UPI001FA9E979|nr:pyridoxal-phosphate dependent enzyme [Scytonema sp. UIC 10036]
MSTEREIPIPPEVLDCYSKYRPTPIFRVKKFEELIGTDCEIYVKDEGTTPSNNHKANSAYLIAYLCKKDKVKTLTTETTGNWGVALAKAARYFELETICFIDAESNRFRPDRKALMEKAGAKVIVVEQDDNHNDLLSLSADAAIQYTRTLKDATYIFGSVYGYFVIPQTIIGLEIKEQLQEQGKYPDIVVGSCGGGANFLGTAAVFIMDHLESAKQVEFFSAEATSCPILTQGKSGLYSIDSQGYYPMIKTYGIEGLLNDGQYIGGLGSTIIAPAVAHYHSKGIIKAKTFTPEEAQKASNLFRETEGKKVALETGYQLAAVIEKAKSNSKKIIVVNISSGRDSTYSID